MVKTRNFKGRNQEAINEFLDACVGAVRVASLEGAQKIAKRGVQQLVNQTATFGDYTAVLVNSYQAVILQNGQLKTRGRGNGPIDFDRNGNFKNSVGDFPGNKGDLSSGFSGHAFRGGNGYIFYTSLGMTKNKISFKTVNNKGVSVRRRESSDHPVNPLSKETIRLDRRKSGRTYEGYGRDMTTIRTYTPRLQFGIEIVFNNPTPYAVRVQEHNKGSRVMPLGATQIAPRGLMVSITAAELYNAVRKAQRVLNKRR